MSGSPPAYGSLDEVMEMKPRYYGNKPAPGPFPNTCLTSGEVETSLLAFSQDTPDLHAALNTIFASAEWISQDKPINAALLRDPPIRVKEIDEIGAQWWPCQLGCPGGIPINGKGTKVTQADRAREHIEWHLGLYRYTCTVCVRTFSRDQARKDHEKVHRAPENVPCEHGCGQRFEHEKIGNMKRHFKYACLNNPNRVTTNAGASGSSSG